MELLLVVGIFLSVVLLIEGLFFLIQALRKPEERKVKRRLRTFSAAGYRGEEVDILRKTVLSSIPWFNRLLLKIPRAVKMSRFLEQANASYPVGFYFLLAAFLGAAAYVAGMFVGTSFFVKLLLTVAAAVSPFAVLYVKKQKRMEKFERQLPDALDMIARALKAGHAFPGGLKMAADEFGDPVGTEFEKTLDEVNFGVGVPEALKAMAERVDCPDLRFFIVSVLIQRETGGNLAEIMENLSYLIRERFKLQGRVRVLSAEGRFSAVILIVFPFALAAYLRFIQPKYLGVLFTDSIGKVLVVAALVMMILGSLVMKQMVKIRV